ncbi:MULTISPECIES: peptidoglycan-binding protein [Kamptonema]|uniref:peptidoglycan-binding protein n=1 Tax=Kamptonema TaxID=1501433 RepID=UPI0001DAC14A
MDKLTDFDLAVTHEKTANFHPAKYWKNPLSLTSIPLVIFTILLTLFSWGNPALALRRGDRGPEVVELQKNLQTRGYYAGETTGFYDAATRAAVRKFQQEKGLRVDGIAGRRTLSKLQSKSEESQATLTTTKTYSQQTSKSENVKPPAIDGKTDNAPKKAETSNKMTLKKTIYGNISPKSVVYSGAGLFFAQNMMYRHTISVYDRKFNLVKTIPDTVKLSAFGFSKFKGNYRGAPVEAAFSTDGKYAYVSNYQMYGSGFKNPGSDRCSPSRKHDRSFLYRINTESLNIEKVIQVGSVPKFNAVSPDNRFLLVSNWCTWDLSVVDTEKNQEVKRIKLGAYPRGIAVDAESKNAYVAVMGSSDIAKVSLKDFSVERLRNIGSSPRHLNIDPAGKYLYSTLNGEGTVAKIDLKMGKVVDKVGTGRAPRSMTISSDGQILYVVNYFSNTVSKVRTKDMKVLQKVNVNSHPIGITYDPETKQVWVACYSGSIMIFQD